MAFERKIWVGGDTVTAAHLNRIEGGIEEAMNSQPAGPALPEITAEDDGKVMVANNGEWVNEELLSVGTEHVVFPETEEVSLNSEYDIDFTAFSSVLPSDLQYIAVHNGRRYELRTISQGEGRVGAFYPPDFDIAQAGPSNMPEIAITIVPDGPKPVCMFSALPEDTSHTLTLMAKAKTVVKNEHIPFAIKAGSGFSSIAECYETTASGDYSHAEGYSTTASGNQSHAEGAETTASGECSHAEGAETTASGGSSHAEGFLTTASGAQSHAEGYYTTASGDASHAEGCETTASGAQSHAEGNGTTASGPNSHAEGTYTTANHASQHVFGEYNIADTSAAAAYDRGTYVEIVGNGTSSSAKSNARTLDWAGNEVLAGKLTVGAAPTADMDVATKKYVDDAAVVVAGEGVGSTVQGLMGTEDPANSNTATGAYAHVEGGGSNTDASTGDTTYYKNTASGDSSHAEGSGTTASGPVSHAEGQNTTASGPVSHAEGSNTTASGTWSHAEGNGTIASSVYAHAEGYGGKFKIDNVEYESGAKGTADHTEGFQTMTASGQPGNHAEGYNTRATGGAAHAEGSMTLASGPVSHAEGTGTTASGGRSHAEGQGTIASGDWSHAEGWNTTASGNSSHAEGQRTTASSAQSHAEGIQTTASGQQSHAEGQGTTASSSQSHAEGWNTTASGNSSHAEGRNTTASGDNSHAEGTYTTANHISQHVFGEFNVADTSTAAANDRGTYVEIVGNGTDDSARSNARTLDWSGNETLAGSLTLGKGTADEVTVTATQLKALIAMLSA